MGAVLFLVVDLAAHDREAPTAMKDKLPQGVVAAQRTTSRGNDLPPAHGHHASATDCQPAVNHLLLDQEQQRREADLDQIAGQDLNTAQMPRFGGPRRQNRRRGGGPTSHAIAN